MTRDEVWAIAGFVALILAGISAWFDFPWIAAICGFAAGTYAGAIVK